MYMKGSELRRMPSRFNQKLLIKHPHIIPPPQKKNKKQNKVQEAHWPLAHLRNQFKSINTFAQIYNYNDYDNINKGKKYD